MRFILKDRMNYIIIRKMNRIFFFEKYGTQIIASGVIILYYNRKKKVILIIKCNFKI